MEEKIEGEKRCIGGENRKYRCQREKKADGEMERGRKGADRIVCGRERTKGGSGGKMARFSYGGRTKGGSGGKTWQGLVMRVRTKDGKG